MSHAPNRLMYAALALLALLVAAQGLFTIDVLDRDEARFAQATLQMVESDDYINIAVQDVPRNKKPVGIHWMQVPFVAAMEEARNDRAIWAWRIPSVLGFIVLVLTTAWIGRRLVGDLAAFTGAALLAVTLLPGSEATIAKTDSVLAALIALSLAALVSLRFDRPDAYASDTPADRTRAATAFWLALGFGVLVKGPVAAMVVFLTLIAFWLIDSRRAKWMRVLLHWRGPMVFLAVVVPWLVLIQIATDGEFLREAVGFDLGQKVVSGHEGHGGPFGYHLIGLSLLIFPAILFVPAGLMRGFGALRHSTSEKVQELRFLMAWLIPSWLVFEAVPTKLVHYPLPLYPALALLAGAAIAAAVQGRPRSVARALGGVLFVLVATLLTVIVLVLPILGADSQALYDNIMAEGSLADLVSQDQWMQIAIAAGAVLGITTLVLVAQRKRPLIGFALALALGLGAHVGLRGMVLPQLEVLQVSGNTSAAVRAMGVHPRYSDGTGPVYLAGYFEPSLVFHLGTDTVLTDGDGAASAPLVAIVTDEERGAFLEAARANGRLPQVYLGDEITGEGITIARFERIEGAERAVVGINYSTGDPVKLHIYRLNPLPEATP